MRILTISTDSNVFTEGSAVARRFRLQAQTVDRLDVIVPHGPGSLVQLAGNAAARGFGMGKVGGFLRTLAAGLRIDRPDVVSVQDPFLIGLLGWIIARVRGAQFNVQVHTDLFDPGFNDHSMRNNLLSRLAIIMLRRADSIRVVSDRVRISLEERGVTAPISVLPVFIDEQAIIKATPLNRRHKYPNFEHMVLVVSRLEPEKNVTDAILAMSDILAQLPRTGLVIVGDGSQRQKLGALVEKLGLQNNVVFEGSTDPFPYYKVADLLLVTSHFEGYGMVIIEALASGCPVVSYDVGIAREVGATITTKNSLASDAVAVLRSGVKGRIALSIPSEVEYRDMWRAQIGRSSITRAPLPVNVGQEMRLPVVGFIGQGFIGKNYADDFERRGLPVVRYALEEPYRQNKELIKDCDVVLIAVPTPTTPEGFDDSIVRAAVGLVGEGKIAIIKSTVIPGTTASIQKQYPDKFVMHSPEFLAEATAAYDAAHPTRNIVGMPYESADMRLRAEAVLSVLPPAPFELICSSGESELVKYINNTMLTVRVVYVNLVYDLAKNLGLDYENIRDAVAADPRIGRSHLDPVHKSGHPGAKPGRGAGGHCFIKDFEAFRRMYEKEVGHFAGNQLLESIVTKNLALLLESGKDLDLLKSVYGDDIEERILGAKKL